MRAVAAIGRRERGRGRKLRRESRFVVLVLEWGEVSASKGPLKKGNRAETCEIWCRLVELLPLLTHPTHPSRREVVAKTPSPFADAAQPQSRLASSPSPIPACDATPINERRFSLSAAPIRRRGSFPALELNLRPQSRSAPP